MTNFTIKSYPKSRLATFDVGRLGAKKHHIAGLLEIDVTLARKKISEGIKTGAKISFTSWFLKVVAETIAEDKTVHAVNRRKNTQILFDEVDVSLPLEKVVDGVRVPLVTVIRNVNNKSVQEIYSDIKEAKNKDVQFEKDYVLEKRKGNKLNKLFFNLPQWLRLIVWKILMKKPSMMKKNMGTVIVTGIGITGNASGWILPRSIHNLCFGIGAINKKPWVYKNKIEIREILHLTVLFDHDVIDGAPAAKFTSKLKSKLEDAAYI